MSQLILPRRFSSQPQGQFEIDLENPLTLGLVDGFLRPKESLRNSGITGALPTGISDKGLVYLSASSSSVETFSNFKIPQTTALTVFILARRDGVQPDSGFGISAAFLKTSGIQEPFVHFIKSGTVGERIRINTTTDDDSSNYWETATDWVVGKWMMGAYVFASGSVPVIYRDGVAQTLSSSAFTITGTLKPSNDLQLNSATLRLNGAIGGVLVFDRALSAQEVVAISANPWQMFKAKPRVLYFNVVGSATPTLSSPGVINILTTSATPQVTLTF